MNEVALSEYKSGHHRTWISTCGNGNIRILKRMKFREFIRLLKEMLVRLKTEPGSKPHITVYVSRSLIDEMSDNIPDFINFCRTCLEIEIEIINLD